MKIAIGCDHAGVAMKNDILPLLDKLDVEWEDFGTKDEESVDYPDFGNKVSSMVSTGQYERGILICGTGLGMSMVANRFANVRAALCSDIFSAVMSRRHNDSNVLILGGRVIGDILALELVKQWLEEPFERGRHQMRLDKFDKLGEKAEK
jgi:ribose 5-phosphate isomerase B